MPRELLFSLTRKDFDLQFFRAGGHGGQKVNKTSSACRIVHLASGAVGESRDERSQHQNRALAFERLIASRKFQVWLKVHTSAVQQGYRNVEAKVDATMKPEYLKIETFEPEETA